MESAGTASSILLHPLLDPDDVRSPVGQLETDKAPARAPPNGLSRTRFTFLRDISFAIFPILFMILAASSIRLHDRPKSSYGDTITSITPLTPTIFPIVYAATIGKFLRAIGSYKAERGIKIGTLERLIGSQSIFTALERQVAIRRADFWGLGIILLWLLSPLGGQSSLRLLDTTPNAVDDYMDIYYLPLQSASDTFVQAASPASANWPTYAPLYMTAFRAAKNNMNTSMDLWGNVKIPDISLQSLPSHSDHDWYYVPNDEDISYTSLLGIPVAGMPSSGNSTFNISSHYWSISCEEFIIDEETKHPWNQSGSINQHGTFAMTVLDLESPSQNGSIPFNYTSKRDDSSGFNISTTNCVSRSMYVDSTVSCLDRDCRVTAMRNSLPPPDNDPSDFIQRPRYYFSNMMAFMPGSSLGQNQFTVRQSELPEIWMADPNTNFDIPSYQLADLATLPKDVFSKRLQTSINTFWQSTFAAGLRLGNLTLDDVATYASSADLDYEAAFNTTRARVTHFQGEKYVCRHIFAALTIVISALLLVAVAALTALNSVILSPDILGYVSSYTRDNPYVDVSVPSYISGLERARELSDVRIRLGDVNPDMEVGHIALADVGKAAKLCSGKLYD